jgi:hypothetical protein
VLTRKLRSGSGTDRVTYGLEVAAAAASGGPLEIHLVADEELQDALSRGCDFLGWPLGLLVIGDGDGMPAARAIVFRSWTKCATSRCLRTDE